MPPVERDHEVGVEALGQHHHGRVGTPEREIAVAFHEIRDPRPVVMTRGLDVEIGSDLRSHLPLMLYGALIIGFLVVEPLGLAKIYDNARNYFLVWPFRHARR